MGKHTRSLWMLLIVCCALGVLVVSTLRSQSQDAAPGTQQRNKVLEAENVDTSKFPIVDFSAAPPVDSKERVKRQAKGKKYNSKYTPPIEQERDRIVATTDWEVGLPAFPIEKSVVVVVGTIVKAKAHFSENRTNVYSEFEVQIEEVLKNDGNFTAGSSAIVERAGGRVRFPSGKMMVSAVSQQQMPQVGIQYLLFLTHDGPLGGIHEDYFILTGYELRGNSVYPLDKLIPGHPITAYNGVEKSSFFRDLDAALNLAGLATR
jgi:hypothetical protein